MANIEGRNVQFGNYSVSKEKLEKLMTKNIELANIVFSLLELSELLTNTVKDRVEAEEYKRLCMLIRSFLIQECSVEILGYEGSKELYEETIKNWADSYYSILKPDTLNEILANSCEERYQELSERYYERSFVTREFSGELSLLACDFYYHYLTPNNFNVYGYDKSSLFYDYPWEQGGKLGPAVDKDPKGILRNKFIKNFYDALQHPHSMSK